MGVALKSRRNLITAVGKLNGLTKHVKDHPQEGESTGEVTSRRECDN
ncbi:MAG: hypothetical protein RXS23_08570 [Metallosphaera yellowstonensis]